MRFNFYILLEVLVRFFNIFLPVSTPPLPILGLDFQRVFEVISVLRLVDSLILLYFACGIFF